MAYDAQRIIGTVGWTMQSRSFDGVKLSFKQGYFSLDLDYFKVAEKESTAHTKDKDLVIAWANFKASSWLNSSFLFVNQRELRTVGAHFKGGEDKLSYINEYYYQMGKNEKDQDVKAYLVAISLAYKFNSNFSARGFFDSVSGDKDQND